MPIMLETIREETLVGTCEGDRAEIRVTVETMKVTRKNRFAYKALCTLDGLVWNCVYCPTLELAESRLAEWRRIWSDTFAAVTK